VFNTEVLRILGAKLHPIAFSAKLKRVEIKILDSLGTQFEEEAIGRGLADGLALTGLEIDDFKGTIGKKANVNKPVVTALTIAMESRKIVEEMQRGLEVGESVNLARCLAATPPNVAHPKFLVNYCRQLARRHGLKCSVIDAKKAYRLKMGGLLAVGSGGSTPPALICLEYYPKGERAKKPIVLVGKAVTFDTGGYSIKPSAGMESMKYDKCGGTAVIGTMETIARRRVKTPVVGIIAAAENMIDRDAYRPSDIIRMLNGVTVEVTNTDAEGRLILADAIAYGCKRYDPLAVIDLATLTGGVVVALGTQCAGMFCNNSLLKERLIRSGEKCGERLWELPLWEEYRVLIKGTHSDIVNSGGREAHPAQGAVFLSYFIDSKNPAKWPQLPWAHLDIAGVAESKTENPLFGRGPTGFGVRLLTDLIEHWEALE
jgi:leucyl aminopeptidase